MTDKPQNFDDMQTEDVTVERNGIERTYRVRELHGDEAAKIFHTKKPNGKTDPDKARQVDSRMIAASVTEIRAGEEPRKISFDEAQGMGMSLRRRLTKLSLKLNGLDDDEEDEKN